MKQSPFAESKKTPAQQEAGSHEGAALACRRAIDRNWIFDDDLDLDVVAEPQELSERGE
jgi:hypothetical protein